MLRFKAALVAIVAYSSSTFAEECVYETEYKKYTDHIDPHAEIEENSNIVEL